MRSILGSHDSVTENFKVPDFSKEKSDTESYLEEFANRAIREVAETVARKNTAPAQNAPENKT